LQIHTLTSGTVFDYRIKSSITRVAMSKTFSNFSTSKGFSLIELLIVVVITGILASIALPNLITSRRSANEASAISSLKTISNAEAAYQFSMGAGQYGSLSQLYNSALIDSQIGISNRKHRYLFELVLIAGSSSQTPGFTARARPQHHVSVDPVGGAGTRDFGISESGVLYQTSNATIVDFDATTRLPTGSAIPFKQY
jgi:prepilin-type N-terminal cleavage/methylation domain-containing protein